MAIATSIDSALPCAYAGLETHRTQFQASLNFPLFISSSRVSNLRRLLPINFSADASDCPPLSTNPQSTDILFNDQSDPKTLNDFICRLCGDPRTTNLAYDSYLKAKQRPNFIPTETTLNNLLQYFNARKRWEFVAKIVEDCISFGVRLDQSTCFTLVGRFIRARKFKAVATILDALEFAEEGIAVRVFGSAAKSYNKLHMYTSTIDVHKRMESLGIGMDSMCLMQIMEAYSKIGENKKSVTLFKEHRRKMDFDPLFSARIYRILFESLGNLGKVAEAYEIYKESTLSPDSAIYSTLISSLADMKEVQLAEELFIEATNNKMLHNLGVFQKLVSMYVEEDSIEKTLDIVSAMKDAQIRVSDNILCVIVNGYAKKRSDIAAAKLYEELISDPYGYILPGQVTFSSMISIYCRLRLYSKAESIFLDMQTKGFDRSLVAYSTIIAMYGKTNRIHDASRLVARMKEKGCNPNSWVYNALLEMHGREGDLKQVDRIWREMKRRKVIPDRVSYSTVMSALFRSGSAEECIRVYEDYKESGGKVDRAMAGILVAALLKTNKVNELLRLLVEMKREGMELDGRLYWSAIGALREAGMPLQVKWLQKNFGSETRR